jgi:hypothetical protein
LVVKNFQGLENPPFPFPMFGNRSCRFSQALENLMEIFPRLGTFRVDFSKPWKIPPPFFWTWNFSEENRQEP